MKIKLKTSIVGEVHGHFGDIVEMNEQDADRLIELSLAEEVKAKKKKAVKKDVADS